MATLAPANYLLSGWVGSDNANVTKTAGTFDSANAGTAKTVTVSLTNSDYAAAGSTNLSNYSLPTTVSGAVGTINKANATVTANSDTKTYSGLTQSVTGFTASGLVNSETIAVLSGVSTTGGSGTNAGSYAHSANGTDGNYNLSFVTGALTIAAVSPPPPVEPTPVPAPAPAPVVVIPVIDLPPPPLASPTTLADTGTSVVGGGVTGRAPVGGFNNLIPLLNVNPDNAISLKIEPTGGAPVPAESGNVPAALSPVGNASRSAAGGDAAGAGQVGAGGISISLNTAPSGNVGGGVQNSVVTVSVPKAMATAGTGFSFAVPIQIRESLGTGSVQATLADGNSLPGWIEFNPVTRRFEAGAVPDGGLPLQVMIRSGATQVLIVISERAE